MEDLSQHILDLLMNSLEAGATKIVLTIKEDLKKDVISICVVDNGKGMDSKEIKRATNPFTTYRSTRRVGLGLSLIQGMAHQCNGSVLIKSLPNKGCKVLVKCQRSHWDLPPLGDLPGTISAFLCSDKLKRFIYKHSINNKNFTLDTKEISRRIKPVSIRHPKILQWVKLSISSWVDELKEVNK